MQAEEPQDVRLNYPINVPWSKVLSDLAEATGSRLVMHDVPHGNYQRQDWAKHTRDEAIKILNQTLEPDGYRILATGQDLTVLKMSRARSEFCAPVSPEAPHAPLTRTATAPSEVPHFTRNVHSVTDDLRQPRSGKSGDIVQASGARSPEPIITSGFEQPLTDEANQVQDSGPVVTSTIQPQTETAVNLARKIYETFVSRAELVDKGPNGLPAFRVYHQPPQAGAGNPFERDRSQSNTWFTMEIDTDRNRLALTATQRTTRGITQLVQQLDRVPGPADVATRVVAGDAKMMNVGRELQPELSRLRQARATGQAAASSHAPPMTGIQLAQNDAAAQSPDAGTAPPSDQQGQIERQIPAMLGGLRGEVTIEALEDLNLLILRGNETDIEQVLQVIQAVEQLAVGTRPEIHLLFLRHVNSDALAELLNDLYEQLGGLQNVNALPGAESVQVIAVGTPNAVLIIAPATAMTSVLDLAEKLDQPGDPSAEVDVFPLKTAVATQVEAFLDDFYAERTGLGQRVTVTADVRTNTIVVHARPRDLEEVRLIIRRLDRDASRSVLKAKTITLTHAVADELADFLNTTLQSLQNPPTPSGTTGGIAAAATQGPQELREAKAVVLEFLAKDGNAQKLVRSGLLSDIRINPDLRTNSLLVTAPAESLQLIEELIRVLDQPSATVADIKVFELENSDAATTVDLLTELFAVDDANEQLGIAIAGAEDASSSLIPLKFSVDPRANAIVAIGGAEALRVVEAIILRLDSSESEAREPMVIKLRNSQASVVAAAINEFVQSALALADINPDRFGTADLLDQAVVVVAEDATNNLLINASPRYYNDIMRIVADLDAEPPQVVIQAVIVEVELQDTDEWGVELGFQDGVLFDRSITSAADLLTTTTSVSDPGTGIVTTTQNIISQGATPGFQFNNQPLGNNIAGHPSKVGGQGLSNFALGRTNADLGFGGLVLSASSESVSMLLRALQARRNIRVLSRPQVFALDNQEALVQDGQLVPTVNGVIVNGLTTSPTIEVTQVGIILRVTPRISPEGQVVMAVTAEKSALSGTGVPIFVDATTGGVIESPIIDITVASTTVKVQDSQTVILGGMIIDEDFTDERKVPWLGDIPLIGNAFRMDSHSHRRAELLVFLTPAHHSWRCRYRTDQTGRGGTGALLRERGRGHPWTAVLDSRRPDGPWLRRQYNGSLSDARPLKIGHSWVRRADHQAGPPYPGG